MAIAKRNLKDPDAPIVRRSPSEVALSEAKLELSDLKARHKIAVAAQIENERGAKSAFQRDLGIRVEKEKLAFKIERATTETELLSTAARAERGKTADAGTAWRSAQRRRAQSVLALRQANKEISELRKQGISGAVDLAVIPGGFIVWDHILLAHSGHVGQNGQLARQYLQQCCDANLITRAELGRTIDDRRCNAQGGQGGIVEHSNDDTHCSKTR